MWDLGDPEGLRDLGASGQGLPQRGHGGFKAKESECQGFEGLGAQGAVLGLGS